jgi:hypothetical protein
MFSRKSARIHLENQILGPSSSHFGYVVLAAMRSQRSARGFLISFFSVTLAAVFFRFDTWPLTWVPMYAAYEPASKVTIRVWNSDEVRRGFLVTKLDGSREYVNSKRLNIPRTKFIRLYYERIYGVRPAKDVRDHLSLSPMNRRLRELAGTYPSRKPRWDWRILYALNKSLRREPGQPDFIVAVEASALERKFAISDLNDGGGVTPAECRTTATALWQSEWLQMWIHEHV